MHSRPRDCRDLTRRVSARAGREEAVWLSQSAQRRWRTFASRAQPVADALEVAARGAGRSSERARSCDERTRSSLRGTTRLKPLFRRSSSAETPGPPSVSSRRYEIPTPRVRPWLTTLTHRRMATAAIRHSAEPKTYRRNGALSEPRTLNSERPLAYPEAQAPTSRALPTLQRTIRRLARGRRGAKRL